MKPTLAWFSPAPRSRIDVANYFAALQPQLDEFFDVRQFVEFADGLINETTGEKYRCSPAHFPVALMREMNRHDLAVYQLANDLQSPGHIWFLSRQKPGLAILHDHGFHEIIFAAFRRQGARERYLHFIAQDHGSAGADAAAAAWQGTLPLALVAQKFPLTDAATANAVAVIVATQEVADQLPALSCDAVFKLPTPTQSAGAAAAWVGGLREIVGTLGRIQTRHAERRLADRIGSKLGAFCEDGKVPGQRDAFYARTVLALFAEAAPAVISAKIQS